MAGMEEKIDPFGSTAVIPVNVLEECSADLRLQVGTVLQDRFKLVEEVAEGSMGVVYKAQDQRPAGAGTGDHWVTIKVLSPQLSQNADTLRVLQQEAVKTRCLAHPNIVRFVELDREDDLYFMVMEWLVGCPLSDLLNSSSSKNLNLTTALDIVRQVAGALDYAHQRGVVHADVKPDSIMMTPSGQVKLFDFGVARIRQKQYRNKDDIDAGPLDSSAPAYSSMQVLTGEDPVPADDVFALACLAYRLIAGYRVFGPRDAAEAAEAGMEPQPIESLNKAQWQALRKALAFSRVARYASPGDFVAALTASMETPVVAPQLMTVANQIADIAIDIDDIVMEQFESSSSKGWWLAAVVLISAGAAAFLFPDELNELLQPYTTANTLTAPVATDAVEAGLAESRPVDTKEVDAVPGASDKLAEIELEAHAERLAATRDVAVDKESASGMAESGALSASGNGFEPVAESSELTAAKERSATEKESSAAPADEFPGLPAADIVVSLVELGALPDETSLTLVEDGKSGIIEIVRRSYLDEVLTLRLVDISDESLRVVGQFHIANDGLIVFPIGQSRARVTVTMLSDRLPEPDYEVTLAVRDAVFTDVEFAKVKLTLKDDDRRAFEDSLATNTLAFTASQVSVRESNAVVQIDVIRFNADASALEIDYTIHDVTATEGEDYIAPDSLRISFAAGQRMARILIPIVQDAERESDEAFMLELPANGALAESNIYRRIAVMIRDDDS